ncbi:major facilitator family transporter [Microlunatus endophyticus]|uniref:Major facilitator family transporter n=1 Tax=Microlunatus endophyticus TaxID=1716077 RepID=A0A917S1R1_9ACTN|nr:MFS transporter [Microlunatus endophyticus]GGL49154.1 major facilitator family transporter [Microlunatus endophyticus]
MHVRRNPGWQRVAVALATVAWGGNQFTPLLVMYRQHSGFSSQAVTVLLAAYVIGIIPALLLGGPLSDRHGRRPLMYPAVPITALASLLLALGADSEPVLFVGRMLSGVALGLGMAVGTSWLKELRPGSGASLASTALTAGFAIGAGAAAALAQFAPWPTGLAYLVHILLAVAAMFLLIGTPETRISRPGQAPSRPLLADLVVPKARERRFLLVLLPMAPWIFGFAGSAYAILPNLLVGWSKGLATGLSGLHCLIALGCGIAVQPLGRRLTSYGAPTAIGAGLGTGVVGLLIGGFAIAGQIPAAFLVAAAVLGCGYGLLMVAGLAEVQRLAGPDDLAGLTAVFYSLSYLGFFVPAVLAGLSRELGYPLMFAGGAVLGLVALGTVLAGGRSTRPEIVVAASRELAADGAD